MKKLFKNLFTLAICTLLSAGFVACSDDDPETPPPTTPDEPTVTPTTDMTNEGFYKGDLYAKGTGNMWINFISNGVEWDDFEEEFTGNGAIVCLDFNTTLASNPDLATLPAGTYEPADDNYGEFTFNLDGATYVTLVENSVSTECEATGGKITVTDESGYKKIVAELTLDNGQDYTFEYVGKLNIMNRTGEGHMSNLTGDVTINNLTQAVAYYYGETFTETSDYCAVVIAGPDFDLDENLGQSPSVMLGLNVTPGSTTGIPSGTYTIIDAMEADDYDVNTALSGVYDPTYGGYFGTWYNCTADGLEGSMKTGTITVTNNGDGTYKFDLNLKDGYTHAVTGTYTGSVTWVDWSE